MKIVHEEVFSCTPKTLFGWLDEPEKAVAWMKSVSKTEIEHRTENKIGTTFVETVQDAKGSIKMRGTITAHEKDRLIAFHLDSRVNSLDVEYAAEPTSTGTRLAVTSSIHWKFPVSFMAVFLGGKIKSGITSQLVRELAQLRRLCE